MPMVTLDSSVNCLNEHVAMVTCSSDFQLRQLRAIRRSVSSSTFTSIVHAFIYSWIDHCNLLLPKVHLSPLQSVLDAAVGLLVYLPRFFDISLGPSLCSFTIQGSHAIGSCSEVSLRYYSLPLSVTLLCPLWSSDGLEHYVPAPGPLWLNPDPFATLVPHGIDFPSSLFHQCLCGITSRWRWVFPHHFLTWNPVFSLSKYCLHLARFWKALAKTSAFWIVKYNAIMCIYDFWLLLGPPNLRFVTIVRAIQFTICDYC